MKKIPPNIVLELEKLERNDPDQAERIAFDLVYSIGFLPESTRHYMEMLQDDPSALRGRLRGVASGRLPGVTVE